MFLKVYCIALPIFFALDMVWLGLAAKNFYAKTHRILMKTNVNWAAAISFYLLFIAGLVVFVVTPAIEKGSWARALLFGHISVSLPMRPTISRISPRSKNWSPGGDGVDLIWGTVLAASVSVATYAVAAKLAAYKPLAYELYRTLAFVLWGYMTLWFLISWFKKKE